MIPALLLAGVACVHCTRSETPAPAPPGFTLVFSASLLGNLEPCGCSPDQRGGVAHAAASVDAVRAQGRPVLLFDGGDRFFPDAAPPDDPLVAQQHTLQAHAMAEATREMRYDALVLGARDAGAGLALLQDEMLPPLVDTGATALPGTVPFVVREVSGTQVGLIAVGSGEEALRTLHARAAGARAKGARVLLLVAYRSFEEAKALLPAARETGIAFVVASRADHPQTHESAALADETPALFTVAARGEALLRVDVVAGGAADAPFRKAPGEGERQTELDALGQRIDLMRRQVTSLGPADPMRALTQERLLELEARRARLSALPPPELPAGQNAFSYAFVTMTPGLPESPAVRQVVDRYDAQVATKNRDYALAHPRECPRAPPEVASYVGDRKCAQCHQAAFDFWKTTPHAKAYATLVDKNKQYSVSCIGCHVLGYEKAGGACSIVDTEGRQNVQCESCHGPGSLHAKTAKPALIARDVPATTCLSCHDRENSPHFNDGTYRPQVLGPGHGQPMKK